MSGFKDILFPTQVSFRVTGGPQFLTNVVTTSGGREFRDQVWSLERGEWDISFDARVPRIWETFKHFFRVTRGRAYSFRFKDWSDYQCDASEGFFVLLTATTFQTWKRYEFDGETYDRKITKLDGVPTITGGTVASVDQTTGIATMTGGTPLTWTGPFHCHARLDTDRQQLEIINRNIAKGLIVGWHSITIVEVKD